MPIYEFKCRACGYRFSEFFRTMHSSDESIAPPCPRCHSTDTVRVVSSFAVHGPSQPDPQEVAAQKAYEERLASITPKEMIDKWRSSSKKEKK